MEKVCIELVNIELSFSERTVLDIERPVLEYINERSDHEESKIRSALHEMGFAGNDLKKNVRQISGGEAIRLVLCQLFLGRYNVLVLDEPTNFLDAS